MGLGVQHMLSACSWILSSNLSNLKRIGLDKFGQTTWVPPWISRVSQDKRSHFCQSQESSGETHKSKLNALRSEIHTLWLGYAWIMISWMCGQVFCQLGFAWRVRSKKMGNGIDHGEISRFYDGTVQRDMQKWNACQVSSKATVPRPG